MSKSFSFRVSDVEQEYLISESIRLKIPQSEVVRRAVWNQAALSSISESIEVVLVREIDRARQLLDAEFELQKVEMIEQMTKKIDDNNQAAFGKLIEWLKSRLPAQK